MISHKHGHGLSTSEMYIMTCGANQPTSDHLLTLDQREYSSLTSPTLFGNKIRSHFKIEMFVPDKQGDDIVEVLHTRIPTTFRLLSLLVRTKGTLDEAR